MPKKGAALKSTGGVGLQDGWEVVAPPSPPSPLSSPGSPVIVTPSSEGNVGAFAKHKGFTPNVDAGFINNFNKLAIHKGWTKEEKKGNRSAALVEEFNRLFGTNTSDVHLWQKLCQLVGITDVPPSIKKCKKALGARKVMVNLVNFVDHLSNGTPLKTFANFKEFRKYTVKPNRKFGKEAAKQNGFIRVLLRQVG